MLSKKTPLICLLFVSIFFLEAYPQKVEGIVAADGVIEYHNRIPLSGATLELYYQGNLVKKTRTRANGEYHFALDYNKEYIMVVYKNNMVKKKFYYNTKLPEGTRGDWWIGIPINLYELCPGIDASIFEEPIVKLEFDPKKKQFDINKEYEQEKKQAIRDFEDENDKCLNENFVKLVRNADKAFLQKDYDKARELYQTAVDKRPWEIYPQERLERIDEIQAKQGAANDVYTNTIKQADEMFNREEYIVAKTLYKRALLIKPTEQYPNDKLAEIDQISQQALQSEAEDRAKEAEYNMLINNADKALQAKDFTKAKELFTQASNLNPSDIYPKNKLREIDRLIQLEQMNAQQQEKINQQYNELIKKANSLFSQQQFEQAKQLYTSAHSLKPEEILPSDKIKQIDAILAQRQKEEELKQKQAEEAKFNELVKQGDADMSTEDYYEAILAYKQALEIKPYDSYTKSRLNKAERDYQDKQDEMRQSDIAFNQFISQGENLTRQGNYEEAKTAYEKAILLKPNEALPRQKVNEIEQLINKQKAFALQKQKETEYQSIISDGDRYLSSGQYNLAKQTYERAANLIPENTLAKEKIKEAEEKIIQAKQLLADKQREDEDYKKALADGAALLAQKNYVRAKQAFAFAANLKPQEEYPKQQIAIVDREIEKIKQQEAQQRANEQAYNAQIVKGDSYLRQKNIALAKQAYEEALRIKLNDNYAQQKLTEINGLIAQEKAKNEKEQQLNRQYSDLLAKADALINQGQYDNAKSLYLQAKNLKPNESYLQSQLIKVNQLIEEENQKKALEQKRQSDYQTAIAKADAMFKKADYNGAKEVYQAASNIKPSEDYPKKRINQIDDILSKLAAQSNVATVQTVNVKKPRLEELKFNNDNEREEYLVKLKTKYPPGITLEVYKEERATVNRYIIVRNNKANEFREIKHNWGGVDYSINGKPITSQYFQQQTKRRNNEYFNKMNK